MIGYKLAKNNGKRVIITLSIPEDAITNINRKNIVDKNTAKHRTDKATVLKIEDSHGNEYTEAKSSFYGSGLEYKLNETLIIEDYDTNLETVCSTGIHFFLERRVAELYNLDVIENGLYQSWYDNGQKQTECNFVNGKLEGLYQINYTNGQKWYEYNYVNGKKE
jgi:antitoxin component YwqK of YwqJK toxin-antitoxin module